MVRKPCLRSRRQIAFDLKYVRDYVAISRTNPPSGISDNEISLYAKLGQRLMNQHRVRQTIRT